MTFPIEHKEVRELYIFVMEACPECGGALDTGYECNDCGFDALPEVRAFEEIDSA